MTTKIHLVVGTDHELDSSWRQPCHEGCTTWQPGTKGCQRWSREELFRRCEAEVGSLPPDTRSQIIARKYAYRDAYTLKTPARFGYIHSVEWMPETYEEFERWMRGTARTGAERGWSEMEIVQETANIWNRLRQNEAMSVLFAYGRIDRSEIKAAMARWDFTKPMPGSSFL